MRSVSIVIPVYNAEASIGALCRQLVELYRDSYDLQIVLVNDGSRDRSDAECRALQRDFPSVITYLKLARNFGEHNAVMAGLHRVRGEWCVIMDDDFQNPPAEVATLLKRMDDGFDAIYASYDTRNDPWYRRAGSLLHDWIATRALGKPRGLYLSSFKALNRFLIDEIVKFQGPDPYLDALILRSTNAVGTITVRHDARGSGHSGYTFRKLVSLWSCMFIAFSKYPIRIVGAVGLVILIWGVWLLIEDAVVSISGKATEVESLRALLVFLRGLSLVAIGVIGEYVGRLNAQLSNYPQFIVREECAAERHTPSNSLDHAA